MCELYGFSGKRYKDLSGELREFYSHSTRHPDGWGIAGFTSAEDDVLPLFMKGCGPAFKSDLLERLLSNPVEEKNLIAHIRLATIGHDEYNNAHPFRGYDDSGRVWTLVHNGTIFEGDVLSRFLYSQHGSTDSERIFLYLVDRMNAALAAKGKVHSGDLSSKERFDVFDNIVRKLSPKNKLNLLVYDGEFLYVHTNAAGTLHMRADEDGITFSTEALKDGTWENAPFTRALAVKDGEIIYEGKSHGNEYIPDEKSIRELFLAYSGL